MARFFVSYSRADEQFLKQFVEILERTYTNDYVWYDRDIPGGADWWHVIETQIEKCDIFIALFSNDALESEYCQKECRYALELEKSVLPVVVRARTDIWGKMIDDIQEPMRAINYVDLSSGFSDALAVLPLIRSINYLLDKLPADTHQLEAVKLPSLTMDQLIDKFYDFRATKKWHLARQILERIQSNDDIPSFFDVDRFLQSIDQEERREHAYTVIKVIADRENASVVRSAIESFQAEFPDYDPSLIFEKFTRKSVIDLLVEPFEWCEIEGRDVEILDGSEYHHVPGSIGGVVAVETFKIGKFTITNAQFQRFVDDDDGYRNPTWWNFSPYAENWRAANKQPKPSAFKGANLPRTNVCWFEAIAFCQWLSAKSGDSIMLPTEAQWQSAAQGPDALEYPWGDSFQHSKVSHNARGVVEVTEYQDGASPHGVLQMSGNVLEWCLTEWKTDKNELTGRRPRVVRGGSWYKSPEDQLKTTYRLMNYPDFRADNRGFRIALNLNK